MVEPRREDVITAKIAAVLVWNRIVRVVAPCTLEAKGPYDFTLDFEAGEHAKTPVRVNRMFAEHIAEITPSHFARLPFRRVYSGFMRQAKIGKLCVQDVIFRCVVADGV